MALVILLGACSEGAGAGGDAGSGRERNADGGIPTPVSPRVVEKIPVGELPAFLLNAFDSIWVVNHRSGSVSRIDRTTNEVVGEIDVAEQAIGLVRTGGSLWTLDWIGNYLREIDARSSRAGDKMIFDSDGGSFAAVGRSIFYGGGEPRILEIDPRKGKVVGRFDAAPLTYGLTFCDGSLWHMAADDPIVYRYSLAGVLEADVEVGRGGSTLACGAGSLWASLGEGTGEIVRVDPATNEVAARIETGGRATEMHVTPDHVWVRNGLDEVAAVDTETGDVVARFVLPREEFPGGGILYADGSLWVTVGTRNEVWRLDVAEVR